MQWKKNQAVKKSNEKSIPEIWLFPLLVMLYRSENALFIVVVFAPPDWV